MSSFCVIDDKHVVVRRILWISSLPHFCGNDQCEREGQYEVRLDADESVWAVSIEQRDRALEAVEAQQRPAKPGK